MFFIKLSWELKLSIQKAIFYAALCATICCYGIGSANAVSLTVQCKVTKDVFGNQRSIVAVRGTKLKGKYYLTVFSGEVHERSKIKRTDNEGKIDFRFDSDISYLTAHPSADQIGSGFIVKRRVVAVLRNASSGAHMGGIDTDCKNIRPRTVVASQP